MVEDKFGHKHDQARLEGGIVDVTLTKDEVESLYENGVLTTVNENKVLIFLQVKVPVNDEYRECADCIHREEIVPGPCSSCEQNTPTNYTEEEPEEFLVTYEDVLEEEEELSEEELAEDEAETRYLELRYGR